jgi:hypothetical protein
MIDESNPIYQLGLEHGLIRDDSPARFLSGSALQKFRSGYEAGLEMLTNKDGDIQHEYNCTWDRIDTRKLQVMK